VGIIRKLRRYSAIGRAANEAAAGSGAPPELQHGMVAAFVNVMAEVMAPGMAATAERRGGPLPGSDPAVADGSAWSAPAAAGAAAIRARDAAFDLGLLATFGEQVFDAVAAVKAGGDSGTVRAVMSDDLWQPLAASTATLRHGGNPASDFARLSQQQVAVEITGLHAGSWYDSAMMVMHVQLAGPLPPDMPPQMTAWDEDWLFQRSVRPGGDPMIRPSACPACGAPTRVNEAGRCQHCQVLVPYLTAGWLVSGIVSHHPHHALARERFIEAAGRDPELLARVPPSMRHLLPADPGQIPARGQASAPRTFRPSGQQ
jgi:hypothetical protein